MQSIFVYLFWPLPPSTSYSNPKVMVAILLCVGLIAGSFALRRWRHRLSNPVTKKLSASWPTVMVWLGISGLFMVVCRVESVSYLSMRFLWVIWLGLAALYVFFQMRQFKSKHYEQLPKVQRDDPRKQYLPQKKKRR